MSADRLGALGFLSFVVAALLLSILTRQGEKLYDRTGPNAFAWTWLRTLRIPVTRENSARFVTITSLFGVLMCLVAIALLLVS